MKKIITAFFILLSIAACKKDRFPNPTHASVSFDIKGKSYIFNKGQFFYDISYSNGHPSSEEVEGYSSDGQDHISFAWIDGDPNINNDSMIIGKKYTIWDQNSNSIMATGDGWQIDSVSLTLTRKSNGTVDGTFSGKVSRYTTPTTNDVEFVTNGNFKNFPIQYSF